MRCSDYLLLLIGLFGGGQGAPAQKEPPSCKGPKLLNHKTRNHPSPYENKIIHPHTKKKSIPILETQIIPSPYETYMPERGFSESPGASRSGRPLPRSAPQLGRPASSSAGCRASRRRARSAPTGSRSAWGWSPRTPPRRGPPARTRPPRENGNPVVRNHVGRFMCTNCTGMLVRVHGLHH